MKRFRFRYESILNMRIEAEDRVKHRLAEAIAKRQALLSLLETTRDRERLYQLQVAQAFKRGMHGGEHRSFAQGKRFYKRKIEAIEVELQVLDAEIEAIQRALLEAMRERKVMEKLKERAYMEFIDAVNAADEKAIEEIVNYANTQRTGE